MEQKNEACYVAAEFKRPDDGQNLDLSLLLSRGFEVRCHLPLGGDWASLALHISMLLVVLPILLIVVIFIVMIVITKHKLRELVL